MVRGPFGFAGRPVIVLIFAAGVGGFLAWTGSGAQFSVAAVVLTFLTIYLINRSRSG
ncbi:MAG TPA: hypothetical protein VHW24_21655 [Bryobacteraceae bacterium]|nr:hypothetical protein [Bryobacteraceae bacterium]